VSDDPERNGADGRPEDAGGSANEGLGRHHGPKARHECDQQRPCRQRYDPGGNQCAFGAETVDRSARWGLRQDAGYSANRESQSDSLFVPPVPREVDREEWSNSGLDVGKKEIQPVQAMERSSGRRDGICACLVRIELVQGDSCRV
jgi:hypothetical protein